MRFEGASLLTPQSTLLAVVAHQPVSSKPENPRHLESGKLSFESRPFFYQLCDFYLSLILSSHL